MLCLLIFVSVKFTHQGDAVKQKFRKMNGFANFGDGLKNNSNRSQFRYVGPKVTISAGSEILSLAANAATIVSCITAVYHLRRARATVEYCNFKSSTSNKLCRGTLTSSIPDPVQDVPTVLKIIKTYSCGHTASESLKRTIDVYVDVAQATKAKRNKVFFKRNRVFKDTSAK